MFEYASGCLPGSQMFRGILPHPAEFSVQRIFAVGRTAGICLILHWAIYNKVCKTKKRVFEVRCILQVSTLVHKICCTGLYSFFRLYNLQEP